MGFKGLIYFFLIFSTSIVTSSAMSSSTYFNCTRLNKSTFMIIENDKYGEIPQIFAKVYPSTIVLIDTGCGGNPNNIQETLRRFLETHPISDNGNVPINQDKRPYTVISTHCHYDHIGGIADFASSPNSTVWASSHNKCFLSPDSLPQNSLCDYVGMKTPKYDISNWSKDGQDVTDQSGLSLNLTIYHTPGHTPDHVAIWDPEERHLFVGDTLYREAPVFFFIGGSVVAYSKTIGRLRELVDDWSSKTGKVNNPEDLPPVQLSCGHITNRVDASEILADIDTLLYQAVTGEIKPKDGGENYGMNSTTYMSKDGSLAFSGFEAVFKEFLDDEDATKAVRRRNSDIDEASEL